MSTIDDIAVLTSENVRLNYSLAGMGSRTTAFILDSLIIMLIAGAISLAFAALGLSSEFLSRVGSQALSFLEAVYILTMAILYWGYYFFFEWINWGQTPGKQALGIRVSMADGAPADIIACAVRNVIRIIDLFLAAIGITFFIMIFTPRYQRLGDLAAGTVVVKRRSLAFDEIMDAAEAADRKSQQAAASKPASQVKIRIEDSEKAIIMRFMERRDSLPPHVRSRLAADLAKRIRTRTPGEDIAHMSDENVIAAASVEITRNNSM